MIGADFVTFQSQSQDPKILNSPTRPGSHKAPFPLQLDNHVTMGAEAGHSVSIESMRLGPCTKPVLQSQKRSNSDVPVLDFFVADTDAVF